MKNIGIFVSENFQFFEMKFSIYLNRCVFVMGGCTHMTCIFIFTKRYFMAGASNISNISQHMFLLRYKKHICTFLLS